ncbi:MAG: flagellar export chaperone FliS [Deltaproteobacteria bacterium]|nr:flagellar export chaperone FliS [Deltaproteobacteria bacterium]
MNDQERKFRETRSRVDAYQKTDVMTANRETILLMMYSAAIRFLKQAIEATDKGDLQEKARLITRTQEIVNELRASLNFQVGGDLAVHLDRLYSYITNQLIQGNLAKNADVLNGALSILCSLNEAWEQAIAVVRKERGRVEKT